MRARETVSDAPAEREPRDRRGLLRALTESTVLLLLAVLLFRTFAAEGFMISTGSMAPNLLGFHKRVVCPTCLCPFPFGVAYDTDGQDAVAAENEARRTHAVCPNCGQSGISVADVPRNHGDQLLVFKQAYAIQPPRRWEVVVFRNPQNPTEAYVKRVAGLPGERIQVIDGDVFADGALCRKDWSDQCAVRIPVHEHRFQPADDSSYRPHWRPLPATPVSVAWRSTADRFERDRVDAGWSWVEYAHWIRRRGAHETSVTLASWPTDIEPSSVPPAGLKYDAAQQRLSCIGALPEAVRDRLLAHPADAAFHDAIRTLYEESHVGPVTDEYGYNPREGDFIPAPVRDIMVSLSLSVQAGTGEFAIELTDGAANFTAVFDYGRQEARLYAGDKSEPVATEPFIQAGRLGARDEGTDHDAAPIAARLEMSLFDQQVLVAWDGKPFLGPWTFSTPEGTPPPRYPARFGADRLAATVSNLVLYRDVYYTAGRSRNGVRRPYRLGDNELFVLGDNSPVSHDSRRWADGAVPMNLLIGKPFLVHLPSKPGRVRIGSHELQLRLPDLERVRLLR